MSRSRNQIQKIIENTPVALTVAGFDGSGGAGCLADCRTFEKFGVYGISALTATVAQSPGCVSALELVSGELFASQLDELSRSFPIAAAKTGMLASRENICKTAEFFESNSSIPLVVDPVLRASAGVELTANSCLEVMQREIFPLATLLTPNLSETKAITGMEAVTLEDLKNASLAIFETCGCDNLVKGGHFSKSNIEVFDILCIGGSLEVLTDNRLDVPDLHGTGCTLSAAITAGLAKGLSMRSAVLKAREYLRECMIHHHRWSNPREIHALRAFKEEK